MSATNASLALGQAHLIARVCDFLEHPSIREAAEKSVPSTMPQTVGGLGFDIPLWVGLGIVGLWSVLDAYTERSGLVGTKKKCATCGRKCMLWRFTPTEKLIAPLPQVLEEMEDLRHLFAHNFVGHADMDYFKRPRHVLTSSTTRMLSCGAQFDGQKAHLYVPHLRYYSDHTRDLLQRFV